MGTECVQPPKQREPANRKMDFIVANRAKKSFPRWAAEIA